MGQSVSLTGMVLVAQPIGEYDKRLVILTKERGKITVFAKGVRRQNSTYLAACNPFVFGEFTVFAGRTSYTLQHAQISNYFLELSEEYEKACYGFYFLEFADYYTKESNDESEFLKLLYITLRAIANDKITNKLIRYIYELKAFVINGEYPQFFCCVECGTEAKKETSYFHAKKGGLICNQCSLDTKHLLLVSESLLYTMQFIISAPLEKLYSFTLSDSVQKELENLMMEWVKLFVDKKFKSLGVLESMILLIIG
jgi:DNA repair protein RecO